MSKLRVGFETTNAPRLRRAFSVEPFGVVQAGVEMASSM